MLLEPARQLTHRSGFTGTLQTCHKNNGRRLLVQGQWHLGLTHQLLELLVHHAHKGLARRQRADDIFAQRLFFHLGNKVFHHWKGHIRFQQGHAHFSQGIANIGFCHAGFATHGFHDTAKPLGQIFQH